MILPSKHIRTDRCLIGIGATILNILSTPMTVSELWNVFRKNWSSGNSVAPISYNWFVNALELLFILDTIELSNGVIRRSKQ